MKTRLNHLMLLLFINMLSSCASTKDVSVDYSHSNNDVIAFSKKAAKAISMNKHNIFPLSHIYNRGTYHEFSSKIYPTSGGINRVEQTYLKFCSEIGGIAEVSYQKQVCKTKNGGDEVLYMVKISEKGKRSIAGRPRIAIELIAPNNNNMLSQGYQDALKDFGYIPSATIVKNRQKQERINELRRLTEQARKKARLERYKKEKPFIRSLGSKICKDIKRTRYVGYTEKVTDTRIQVRVAYAEIIGSKYLSPGNFRPQIIWDYPFNWFLCD